MEISKDEFVEWKNHPVTKEIFLRLESYKSDIKDMISSAEILDSDNMEKQLSRFVGQIEAIDQVLEVRYDDEEYVND